MKSNPYLFFNGDCETAFKFYQQCLGGKIVAKMTYGESPMVDQTPPDSLNGIMHSQLDVGDIVIMGADAPPHMFEKPQGFYVNLQFDNIADAQQIFNALSENGIVRMPFQETFWANRFAMFVDRFGTPWMINCNLAA